MGLARLLNRSNGAPPTPTPPTPAPTSTFMAGPEQSWGSSTSARPSEAQSLSVPAFWRGHAYVCGTVGMLPCVAFRGTDALNPQPPVVLQPDPNQTAMGFWAGVVSSLTLYGNSICIITDSDRNGWPTVLKPVHPTSAAVRFSGNPQAPSIAAWYVAGQIYDPSEVWH